MHLNRIGWEPGWFRFSRGGVKFMGFRAFLFSSILLAGASLPFSVFAQNDPPKSKPDPTQTQPASAPTPIDDQPQPAAEQDKSEGPGVKQDGVKQDEVKHDGSKKDVGAIGDRKVGGFDMYSIETDIKIGRAYAAQIDQTVKLVQDPRINEFVNRVGQNLVRNSDAKVPFIIKVVDDGEINAMALPGGYLYVNTGLILAADDEAELAGVMAHEIAHVALRHATRTQSWANIVQILTIPVVVMGGPAGVIVPQVARVAVPMTLLKFSRGFETEADYFGLQYMYKAGYDPNGLVSLFEKIQAREKKKPGTLAKAFASHPQTPSRIQKSQEEMATILPFRSQYVETTSEFNDVKARLAMLENGHKFEDSNPNKPVLRRTSASDEEKKDDDRPELKRRLN